MSQYRPSIDNLLATVEQFLRELSPSLTGDARYKTQVCSFLLAICQRELATGSAQTEADCAAWAKLLGDVHGDADDLKRTLCARVRDGSMDAHFSEILDVTLARTIDDVRIVRPDHLTSAP